MARQDSPGDFNRHVAGMPWSDIHGRGARDQMFRDWMEAQTHGESKKIAGFKWRGFTSSLTPYQRRIYSLTKHLGGGAEALRVVRQYVDEDAVALLQGKDAAKRKSFIDRYGDEYGPKLYDKYMNERRLAEAARQRDKERREQEKAARAASASHERVRKENERARKKEEKERNAREFNSRMAQAVLSDDPKTEMRRVRLARQYGWDVANQAVAREQERAAAKNREKEADAAQRKRLKEADAAQRKRDKTSMDAYRRMVAHATGQSSMNAAASRERAQGYREQNARESLESNRRLREEREKKAASKSEAAKLARERLAKKRGWGKIQKGFLYAAIAAHVISKVVESYHENAKSSGKMDFSKGIYGAAPADVANAYATIGVGPTEAARRFARLNAEWGGNFRNSFDVIKAMSKFKPGSVERTNMQNALGLDAADAAMLLQVFGLDTEKNAVSNRRSERVNKFDVGWDMMLATNAKYGNFFDHVTAALLNNSVGKAFVRLTNYDGMRERAIWASQIGMDKFDEWSKNAYHNWSPQRLDALGAPLMLMHRAFLSPERDERPAKNVEVHIDNVNIEKPGDLPEKVNEISEALGGGSSL